MLSKTYRLLLFVLIFLPLQGKSQEGMTPVLKVGVYEYPPFVIKSDSSFWDGISVQLWYKIAEQHNLAFDFVEIKKDAALDTKLAKVDVVITELFTKPKLNQGQLSIPYFQQRLGIVSTQSVGIFSMIKAFFNSRFWWIVLTLSILLLLVGTVIYFIERKSNEESFGGERSVWKGIGAGFWWAGVTMTTIGYGDKAPVTFFGRMVAMFWMLMAMAITAVLTATVVSIVNNQDPENLDLPKDLQEKDLFVHQESSIRDFLKSNNINFQTYSELDEVKKNAGKSNKQLILDTHSRLLYLTKDSRKANQLSKNDFYVNTLHFACNNPGILKKVNSSLYETLASPSYSKLLKRFDIE
jgi:hypothetical protein